MQVLNKEANKVRERKKSRCRREKQKKARGRLTGRLRQIARRGILAFLGNLTRK